MIEALETLIRMRIRRRGALWHQLLTCCLCLCQGMETATKAAEARLRAEREAQARAAAAARAEAEKAARERDALRVSGAVQPGAQRGAWAAPAALALSAGRLGAAPVWVPAARGSSVSGAAAAPVSGTPGRTASPAPPPLYARADAMWPRVEARGRHATARTGAKAERPMAGAPHPAAV